MITHLSPISGQSTGVILSTFFQGEGMTAAPRVLNIILHFSDDEDAEDYEDPSNEEILDWMYADEDSRPEEDEYTN